MTVIKNQTFHWEKVRRQGGRCGSVLRPQASPAHTQEGGDQGQLEAQARVRGANNGGTGEGRRYSKYKEEGQGTWSSSERRNHFNGMVIRKGGPGLGKGGGQGEVQPEWR